MKQQLQLFELIERLEQLCDKAIGTIDHPIFIYENQSEFSEYDIEMNYRDLIADRDRLDNDFELLIDDLKNFAVFKMTASEGNE
ncbi:hypothetical protein [Moraxella osloensis]|uniref:hypothetical protein n=1 Tax=Faucicola osloensis TaxID=34062 RepID=UPI00200299DD|nr:hypothetical protein [Moraxella osloensis]MCK6051892.1 hypothetical protein [Moraxella osloensis]